MESDAAFRDAFKSLQRASGEDDVRDALHDALQALGGPKFNLEYPLESGRVDMASEERRVLIETKARNAVGPMRQGSATEETQKDQAERYLRDAIDRWMGDLLFYGDTGEPRVFLTDGLLYWGYEIQQDRLTPIVRKHQVRSQEGLASFLQQYVIPAERRYRPAVPDDLTGELLSGFANELETVYRTREGSLGVQTKIALWRESLSGAGLVPPDDEPVGQASLFVRHTVLVVAARVVKLLLRDGDAATLDALLDELSEGFQAWLLECSEGKAIVADVFGKLAEYQWRGNTRDRLKEAYHKLIDRDERKEFGEYYTPDWLAAEVVNDVLDEDWMDRGIRAASPRSEALDGYTVLDPACGSGTFLFHAARRLFAHIQHRHPRELEQARRIITRMVVGIDVHPIAVEMAEATLEMALPPPPEGSAIPLAPQIFLGDAMQSSMRDDLSSDLTSTQSALGTPLTIPTALLVHPDAEVLIERLVGAAIKGKQVAFDELAEQVDQLAAAQTLASLTKIIRKESDHVWKWHLRHIAGPVRMARTKAGRIVTNPPWLMANDTKEGSRKRLISGLRDDYGLRNPALRRRRSSTEGDLAAVFTARTADLYLVTGGRMGLVLPGGAIINQNWQPWRSGCWYSPAIRVAMRN